MFECSHLFLDQVVALYPFNGQQTDELTFQKGDIITLVSTDDPSWWKGEMNGAVGLFPSNYVEVLLKQNPSTQDNCKLKYEALLLLYYLKSKLDKGGQSIIIK